MSPEARSILRLSGIGIAILALVLGGIVIGVNLGPRAATVEQKVIAPVREAASGRSRADPTPDMLAAACPAVVSIRPAGSPPPPQPRQRKPRKPAPAPRAAAGFLISSDGYVLTAAGALPGERPIEVRLNDGRAFPATRAGADTLSGIALLKIDARGLPALAFAAAGFPRLGETVIALVSPNGTGCTAQAAMVSGDFIAAAPGRVGFFATRPALDDSFVGLPLLDAGGQVIGVAGLDPDRPGAAAGETRALPAAIVGRVASEMMRGGAATENGFGFDAEDLVPVLADRIGADRQRGAIVSLVAPGSAADAAGLKAGDVVFAAAGEPVSGASELARALDGEATTVPLEVMRGGERVKAVLERP